MAEQIVKPHYFFHHDLIMNPEREIVRSAEGELGQGDIQASLSHQPRELVWNADSFSSKAHLCPR